jgi:HEAT repeat protein
MSGLGARCTMAGILLTFTGHNSGISAQTTSARTSVQLAWKCVEDLASTGNPQHRKYSAAAFALLAQKNRRALDAEKNLLLSDREPEVRAFTAGALGQERVSAAVPMLREALDDASAPVSVAAAKALWDMKDRSGIEIFEEVVTGARKNSQGLMDSYLSTARRRMHDPKALALMGVKEATTAFFGPAGMVISFAQENLKDKGAAGRAFAASALADDRSEKSRQILENALQDSSPLVRAAACRSLAIRGDRRSLVYLEPLLDDRNEGTQAMANAAYIRLTQRADGGKTVQKKN